MKGSKTECTSASRTSIRWIVRPELSFRWILYHLVGTGLNLWPTEYHADIRSTLWQGNEVASRPFELPPFTVPTAQDDNSATVTYPLQADLFPAHGDHHSVLFDSFIDSSTASLPGRTGSAWLKSNAAVAEQISNLGRSEAVVRLAQNVRTRAEDLDIGPWVGRLLSAHSWPAASPIREIQAVLFWAPPGSCSSAYANTILLPITDRDLESDVGVDACLSRFAHELGHIGVGAVPMLERMRWTNNSLFQSGLINARQVNVLDEALHCALGNLAFPRHFGLSAFEDGMIYAYNPKCRYPYAIDALAREMEEAATEWLYDKRPYAELIDWGLKRQRQLFGETINDFASVALVWSSRMWPLKYFCDTFAGARRWVLPPSACDQFVKLSTDAPRMTRWLMIDKVTAQTRGSQLLLSPELLDAALGHLHTGAAVLQGMRRGPDAGYDFLAIAESDDMMRKLLVRAHLGGRIPSEQPIIL